jgi:PTH1 family peptidyl-tRNA hydrolase
MCLIVGLGNPGKKYAKTRHNIGFRVIDEIIKNQKSKVKSQNLIFLKPDTFMNQSGLVIKKLIQNSKFKIQNLIVIHDDIDLPFDEIRVSKNSSSAGHKGVQSIIDELKTEDFMRIRMGIRPELKIKSQKLKVNTEKFVLENFTKDEEKQLPEIIKKALDAISALIDSCS